MLRDLSWAIKAQFYSLKPTIHEATVVMSLDRLSMATSCL